MLLYHVTIGIPRMLDSEKQKLNYLIRQLKKRSFCYQILSILMAILFIHGHRFARTTPISIRLISEGYIFRVIQNRPRKYHDYKHDNFIYGSINFTIKSHRPSIKLD